MTQDQCSDSVELEIKNQLLPPPPPTISSSPDDIAAGIASLKSLLLSDDGSMRIEGLKVIADLLIPQENGQNDQQQLIQGFYQGGLIELFVQSLQYNLRSNSSTRTSIHSGSLSSFETHLLLISLGRIIQSKVLLVSFSVSVSCNPQ